MTSDARCARSVFHGLTNGGHGVDGVIIANPPKVSATRGTNSVPEERQAERWAANFLWTPTSRALSGVKELVAAVEG